MNSGNHSNVHLRLIGKRGKDGRKYNLPSVFEVAAVLVVGEFHVSRVARDTIIETQTRDLQWITKLNPLYLGFHYPLLSPYGEDRYQEGILLNKENENTS